MQEYAANFEPPGRLSTLMELRAPLDWASLLYRAPQLAAAPRGDGRPLMLIPGYGADERSMRPLGRYLTYLGYDVYDWAQGRNRGDVENDIRRVGNRTREIHDALGNAPVTLIGWSLGGVSARETARLFERYVREVITMGTPIIGGPKYTTVGRRFAEMSNLDLDEFEKVVHARNSIGIKQPVTSIYSKTDGVVAWQASIDTYNRQARNIEVSSSHFGLGANGEVWYLIAKILAAGAKKNDSTATAR
ncbi:MAG: alpha/beta hydrolase [Gammaproteobacteria bacterium]|nr:alpha/beta hydrolase [Gammaproteobacteria bacterium]MDH3362507.1 alpha/beta hydrolase [Gammaproteobacteria bacterium]MDH3480084.1 alpha/beta hydrolase [Gammaproteobacteria bacterium]